MKTTTAFMLCVLGVCALSNGFAQNDAKSVSPKKALKKASEYALIETKDVKSGTAEYAAIKFHEAIYAGAIPEAAKYSSPKGLAEYQLFLKKRHFLLGDYKSFYASRGNARNSSEPAKPDWFLFQMTFARKDEKGRQDILNFGTYMGRQNGEWKVVSVDECKMEKIEPR